MQINITTPALIFPAISLLLLAYTNRFQALASVIRVLNQRLTGADNQGLIRQIENLQIRIRLIKAMQALGISSLLGCVIAMLCLFADAELVGRIVFTFALILTVLSLLVSLWEIMLSGNALKIELENLRRQPRCPEGPPFESFAQVCAPRTQKRRRFGGAFFISGSGNA